MEIRNLWPNGLATKLTTEPRKSFSDDILALYLGKNGESPKLQWGHSIFPARPEVKESKDVADNEFVYTRDQDKEARHPRPCPCPCP